MKFKLAITVAAIAATLGGSAQSSEDALKYSYLEFGGTARYNAMAGAFGALGGDLSSVHVNPAGLGLYRSSEMTLSPNLTINGADASFLGTTSDDSRVGFNIDNIGLVMAYPIEKGKWKFGQFGISYSRLKDFQNNYTISGENAESTFLEIAARQAEAFAPSLLEQDQQGFLAFPAYNSFLINPYFDEDGNIAGYVEAIPFDAEKEQITDLQTRGKIGETSFSGSFNYDDKLYIGFGFGFQRFVDEQRLSYRENVLSDIPETPSSVNDTSITQSGLQSFTYTERYDLTGNGLNLRVGAIYKVMDEVRLGLSYRSPTWSTMETTYQTEFSSTFEDGNAYTQEGAQLRSESSSTVNDYIAENQRTEEILETGQNIRAGIEYRLKPFSLRAGVASYSNPYRSDDVENSAPTMFYTGGVGYRGKRSYVDFSYRYRTYKSDYYAYDPSIQPAATIEHSDHAINLTFGTRF